MTDTEKHHEKAINLSMLWLKSIIILGFFLYFIPIDFLKNEITKSILDNFVGIRRWANGSFYPEQMTIIWTYIYLSFPFFVVFTFLKMELSIEFNKKIPVFKQGVFEAFFLFSPIIIIAFIFLSAVFLLRTPIYRPHV